MGWKVNRAGAKIATSWKPKDKSGKMNAWQTNWNEYMDAVEKHNQHPRTAATKSMDFKYLGADPKPGSPPKPRQAQIRLTGGERASFFVDEAKQEINHIQLGGHT